MAAPRSLASLTLSFGLVNIPVKLYTATSSDDGVAFKLLAPDGSRLKQQYVSAETGQVVERATMVKGYEFETDQFVLFTQAELKTLQEEASPIVEIVAFVPEKTVDPIYYDRPYFLAPDKRGGKPYALLMAAMAKSGRCALAQWARAGKEYVVQVRVGSGGLVLQQLLYADEVRKMDDLGIEPVEVPPAELTLALQLIAQISQDDYDPTQFKDEEKLRILAAIDQKIAGKQVVASSKVETPAGSGQVIDLVDALRASLARSKPPAKGAAAGSSATGQAAHGAEVMPASVFKDRKPAKRAPKVDEPVAVPAARSRARK